MAASKENPLAGKRVLVTRAPEQAGEFVRALTEAGAVPLLLPVVGFYPPADTGPMDEALRSLEKFDWLIFTSQNAVQAFSQRAGKLENRGLKLRVATVGPSTANAAREAGFRVDYVAREFRGAALAGELGKDLMGKKVLLPRSDRGREDLPEGLRARGAEVTSVIAYSNGLAGRPEAEELGMLRRGEVDVVTFFSPSAFHNLTEIAGVDALRGLSGSTAFAAIGPVTAEAMQETGLRVDIVAGQASPSALVTAMSEYFTSKQNAGVHSSGVPSA